MATTARRRTGLEQSVPSSTELGGLLHVDRWLRTPIESRIGRQIAVLRLGVGADRNNRDQRRNGNIAGDRIAAAEPGVQRDRDQRRQPAGDDRGQLVADGVFGFVLKVRGPRRPGCARRQLTPESQRCPQAGLSRRARILPGQSIEGSGRNWHWLPLFRCRRQVVRPSAAARVLIVERDTRAWNRSLHRRHGPPKRSRGCGPTP